jgi:hypothetical protein
MDELSCSKICPKSKEVASAIVERAWCDCGRQSYITKIINTMQANYSRANCERVECMKLEAGYCCSSSSSSSAGSKSAPSERGATSKGCELHFIFVK